MRDLTVETFEHRGLTITIEYDEFPESPREWSNLGRMVCWHSRYNLGDFDDRKRPRASHTDGTEFDTPSEFREWWNEHGKGGVILPLYLYDHSGITMSTGPFSCPWDSGQVGYIYATREMICKEYGCKRITKQTREKVEKCLESEVKTYDDYLTGQIYSFHVENPDGEDDSCCGMYGLDYCREEATRSADHIANQRDAKTLIEMQYS